MAVEGLDEGLHDAAHARRHAAREHAERELTATDRRLADRREPGVLRRAGLGRVGHVLGARQVDGAAHAIALGQAGRAAALVSPGRAREERRRERHEPLRAEPGGVEAGPERGGEGRELASQLGFTHREPTLRGPGRLAMTKR